MPNLLRRLWTAAFPLPAAPRDPLPDEPFAKRGAGFFSTDLPPPSVEPGAWNAWFRSVDTKVFQRTHADLVPVTAGAKAAMATDSDLFNAPTLKNAYTLGGYGVPDVLLSWYANQGFIGYQMCAIIAQHWLVDKACSMPARDATRVGYEITVNDGTKIDPEILAAMTEADERFSVLYNAQEYVRHCRIYGIRICLFVVDGADYEQPFNIDGVRPGSYRGMSQVDPYWIVPQLDFSSAADPSSINFYEPTYWQIGSRKIHRSWLKIIRTCDVPDVLKPTYFFGGVPLTQRIYERVYAAERTANEGPQLAMTKRTGILKIDMAAATASPGKLEANLQKFAQFRDNYGTKTVDKTNEDYEQFDTALADVDVVIMTQYQLVAAIAEVPATKLLGTMPKGFNATGEYEEASYHEFLESIQAHDVTPLIERHHQLLKKSYICPKFGIPMFDTKIKWNELDAETSAEAADRRLKESQADKNWAEAGAIDGIDIRNRLIKDEDSGYNGIETAIPEGPRPSTVIDPGAEKTAPNAPLPDEAVPPGGAAAPAAPKAAPPNGTQATH